MYPILISWGSFVLPSWHVFYVLGALAAYWLILRLAHRYAPEIPTSELARLYIVCYASGYLGARLLSIVVEESQVQGFWPTIEALGRFGPMTFYGGALGSFAGGLAYSLSRKLPVATIMDLTIPAALLGLALGRIGCFLNGDDYGKPASLIGGAAPFWSVTFPSLGDGVARVPVQLIEAALAAGLTLTLYLIFDRLRRSYRPGAVGFFGIIGYANLRFLTEFLRDDFRGSVLGTWLSTSQFISILLLVACAVTIPIWIRRGRPA